MFLTVGHASLLRFLLVRPTLYLFHSYIVQLFSSLGCVFFVVEVHKVYTSKLRSQLILILPLEKSSC